MSKARLTLAGTILSGLIAVPAVIIPALASSSASSTQSGVSAASSDPLLTVCLTVTPKSVSVDINGVDIVLGPAGVPRNCISTPF